MKRVLSILLTLSLLVGLLPAGLIQAKAAEPETLTVSNDYLSVSVSKGNGGFAVRTVDGNILHKSDNNKDLLYHSGDYDTSFLSVEIDGKDYLFGGKYDTASDVAVTQDGTNGSISSVWKVAGITFTETVAIESNVTHNGMLALTLTAVNASGTAVPVKARLLLDTCLGEQDYGTYAFQSTDTAKTTKTCKTEQMLSKDNYDLSSFYTVDSTSNPQITAYNLNTNEKPYQVAVGHWNHLASTLFDFAPTDSLDFTDSGNDAYRTADSACALYFDMGNVSSNGNASFSTFYGVYSNSTTPASQSVAVNLTAPTRLALSSNKSTFVRQSETGVADFEIGADLENYKSTATNITLAVRTTGNLKCLSETGAEITNQDYGDEDPYTIAYTDLSLNSKKHQTLYFKAQKTDEAAYEQVTVSVYDTSASGTGTSTSLTAENLIGEKSVYILLPGADGDVPKVSFTNMSPTTVYSSGTRHLYVTLKNPSMLVNRANWVLKAVSADGSTAVEIPSDNITINNTSGVMDVALTDDVQLAVGSWQLRIDWNDSAVTGGTIEKKYQQQTADILRFTVSADPKFKNDTYGVVAVVQYDVAAASGNGTTPTYRIKTFKDEDDFTKFKTTAAGSAYEKEKYKEILLVFRGEFTVKSKTIEGYPTYLTAVSTKTLDTGTQQYKVDNCITINGCMDFEGGTMSIYYESYKAKALESAVCTEFDGDLYTSDARTSIWTGKAIFTKLEQGKEFSLLPYDANGKRAAGFQDSTIKLIWPSVAGAAQTIAGMVFKLAYGELGVMKNSSGAEKGRVVSFSAKLDLSFTGKSDDEDAPKKQNFWYKFTSYWKDYKEGRSLYDYAYNKMDATNDALDWSNLDESPDEDSKQISASALVQDILFGCGEGFVGVNFTVSVAIQNYIDGLPKLSCTLAVNTIGNWSFGLQGDFKMDTFKLQVKVSFMSYNNIPVPDNYYVFVGGFKPGINVDGCGVLWLTGGGGGMSNIYKTIFCSGVPPLKLVMSVSVSLMQVLSAQGTLTVGATGLSAEIDNLKVEGLTTPLIPKAMFSFEWYPGIDLRASIKVSILQIIEGGGYIVLKTDANYENTFFEAFARGSVNVPKSVPAVGGMSLAAVNLGINTEKVWGSLKVICCKLGLTYYWGASSVDFGTGEEAQPTYPQLLGSSIPVGYSEERGQELYARVGTNVDLTSTAEVEDDLDGLTLQSVSPVIKSNKALTTHMFNLGSYSDTQPAAIVSLSYDATSLENAQNIAKTFEVNDTDGNNYNLTMYDGSNAETCNANVTYNETTQKATFAFSVSDSKNYDKDWYITTDTTAASALLYGVNAIPEVTSVSGTPVTAGDSMTATWNGSSLSDLSKMSFYLTPVTDDATIAGYSIGEITSTSYFDNKTATLTVPADVPAGNYYLRCVYSKDDQTNNAVYSADKIHVTNANTPAKVGSLTVESVGDLKIGVTVPASSDSNTTGYEATVYNSNGTATDISALRFDKAASGDTTFDIGGSYKDSSGKATGLTSGTAYKVSVTPYKLIDSNNDGTKETIVYGAEVKSDSITLPAPSTAALIFSADQTPIPLARTIQTTDENGAAVTTSQDMDTYAASALTITAASNQSVTGTWTLDKTTTESGEAKTTSGSFTGTSSISIPLTGLKDGDHTLTITGKNAAGDGFTQTYAFAVDTTPPRLMLTSPVNGSVFNEDGTLTITGITDPDALFTITCDGNSVCEGKKVTDLNGTIYAEGVFAATVNLADPDNSSTHNVTITATDAVGNHLSYSSTVTHGGLGNLASMDIQYNSQSSYVTPTNGNIPVGNADLSSQLRLLGSTGKDNDFVIDTGNVTWTCTTVNGTASVSDTGLLTASAGAQGFVTAKLEVTDGAYLTASSSFGADNGSGQVITNATLGGTVTGGGYYNPGDTVTLTAVPNAGYSFSGWTITGVTGINTSAATITFKLPASGDVTATASFTSNGSGLPSSKFLTATLPSGSDPNTYIPYYYNASGVKTYVPLSAVIGGKLVYLNPGVKCSFEQHSLTFTDVPGHWAENDINFAAARAIVNGVGDNLFDPNGTMTRAMFVTVLWRMAGSPAASASSKFTDVEDGSWYASAVYWAAANGIVSGYGDGRFGPEDNVTREQLCVLVLRYVKWLGLTLNTTTGKQSFPDAAQISDWAVSAVDSCQTAGLVNGKDGGIFDPQNSAARAEATAIIHRMINNLLS